MKAMLHAATSGAPDIRARGHCLDCAIRQHAVCSDCTAPELNFLTEIKTYRNYKSGERLLEMGERAPFMGTIVEGVGSMSRILPDGRRQVVGLLFPCAKPPRSSSACWR